MLISLTLKFMFCPFLRRYNQAQNDKKNVLNILRLYPAEVEKSSCRCTEFAITSTKGEDNNWKNFKNKTSKMLFPVF